MFTQPDVVIPDHLAYVEWYTRFPAMPDRNLLMYKISPLKDQNGGHICIRKKSLTYIALYSLCSSGSAIGKSGCTESL